MCLIEITLTAKASEKPDLSTLFFKYMGFFRRSKIVSTGMQGDKFVVKVYVRFAENKVSEVITNVFSHDSKIEKACIIS